MAQEEIKFTKADNGNASTPNDGGNFDIFVTYDPTVKNADGSYTVTAVSGTIQKLSPTGAVVGTDKITGVAQPSASFSFDNELFTPANPNTSPIVTGEGFGFTIDNKADTLNPNGDTPGIITLSDGNGSAAGFAPSDTPSYLTDSYEDNGNPLTNFTVTQVTCFVTGTRIRTTRGEVVVEQLAVGDRVVTGSGRLRPIVWIGHREMSAGDGRADVWPVRILANAFGAGCPARDLYLSPGHPILVGADEDGHGGHLVPVMCLVNGTTVARVPADTVTYWHIELDAHDILLAEGLAAESYLDWGDRAFFEEGADHRLANPDFIVPGLDGRCRPVVVDGPVVDAERARLAGLFNARLSGTCAWPVAAAGDGLY